MGEWEAREPPIRASRGQRGIVVREVVLTLTPLGTSKFSSGASKEITQGGMGVSVGCLHASNRKGSGGQSGFHVCS